MVGCDRSSARPFWTSKVNFNVATVAANTAKCFLKADPESRFQIDLLTQGIIDLISCHLIDCFIN